MAKWEQREQKLHRRNKRKEQNKPFIGDSKKRKKTKRYSKDNVLGALNAKKY